ncbi:MAG: 50S ribosome-binding GTPase [Candidatus Diapherotrites archaeon]|nr:50S ribosome-binding GTPase [Candidatus Diapherotrites archaeon]
MPTNVSIEYANAAKKYYAAKTPLEKLAALEEMKSQAPGHKGGERLRAELARKIAQLKSEIERQSKIQTKKGAAPTMAVKKEGAGQIVLMGLPASGKSTLLNALTGMKTPTGPQGFTTREPAMGMMRVHNANVQLVELPGIVHGSSEGKANGPQVISVARNADALCLIVQGRNATKDVYMLVEELEKSKILLNKEKPGIEVKQNPFGGIHVDGKSFLKMPVEQLTGFLKSAGYAHCHFTAREPVTMEKLVRALDHSIQYKKALCIAWGAAPGKEELEKAFKGPVRVFQNVKDAGALEELREPLFNLLGKILVYTKKPGREPDLEAPMVLDTNNIVADLAKQLHKDLALHLKYVRVWGSTKFPGQRVPKTYNLKHKDIVEISA